MVPFGNVASELWALLGPPISKRRDAWLSDLARRLHDLEGQVEGFRFDDLGQNEQFVSATLQATQAVLKTEQAIKLDALRNAVINVALGKEPDADRQTIFLSLVDRFTALHIILLRFFDDPDRYCAARGRPLEPRKWQNLPFQYLLFACIEGLEAQIGSPEKQREVSGLQLIELVLGELAGAHLTRINTATQKPPTYCPWTSHFGRDFLDFITTSIPDLAGSPIAGNE